MLTSQEINRPTALKCSKITCYAKIYDFITRIVWIELQMVDAGGMLRNEFKDLDKNGKKLNNFCNYTDCVNFWKMNKNFLDSINRDLKNDRSNLVTM